MDWNPFETQYPKPEPENKPEMYRQRPRSRAGSYVGMALLALGMSVAGTLLTYRALDARDTAPAAQNRPVTIQTVQTDAGAASVDGQYAETAIERVAAQCGASVVEVTTEQRVTHQYWGSFVTGGAGSGVIVSEDGYIITNDHVVTGADSIGVRLSDGTLEEAVLVGADPQTDLAVLRINRTGLTPAVFGDSSAVRVGELAVAIGNPLGTLGGTVTEGIISAKDREIIVGGEDMVLLQTSAAISPGNSGGGLFDRNGHLVGVVNAKSQSDNVEGIGFAIPANTAMDIAAQLIAQGFVSGRPVLGIEAVTINSFDALFRYRVSTPGVYVTRVTSSSGLAVGDRIVAVAGQSIDSVSTLKSTVSGYAVGDALQVQIVRGGRSATVSVVLEERGADASASLL